ncbi:class I SAM-dependent methyltransferase [Cerasicoccus fimbriatus]|uniref:class I SAM-dependent methyltransferase n=1 Tax=Cerasicoccus fimbriatus TaxID=3014554 RepID=UPI0022B465FE|nr:class I SAM-dependent methyltransferase [Cerasicoccus sp. TK19100]
MSDNQAGKYDGCVFKRGMRNTDIIAFRCVADLLHPWVKGKFALDVGCGSGRSTTFLCELGADAYGVDTDERLINEMRELSTPFGNRLAWVKADAPLPFPPAKADLVFSSWMLLELGSQQQIISVLKECRRVLKDGGRAVFVVNTAEFYAGDWVSLDVSFPENQAPLQNGQAVKARLLPEGFVVSDYFWSEESYVHFFTQSNFAVQSVHKPLGLDSDGIDWKDERHTAPYAVYELVAK